MRDEGEDDEKQEGRGEAGYGAHVELFTKGKCLKFKIIQHVN